MADVPPERPLHLLAAHPAGSAVLAEAAPDGSIRLPLLGMLADLDAHPLVAGLVQRYLGAPHPILRVLPLGEDEHGWATDVLVEVEPLADADPPESPDHGAGLATTWIPLDDPRLDALRAADPLGPHIGRWVDEQVTGRVDSRRQRWERPGALARARTWMRNELERAGTPALAEPTIEQLWCISAVLRVDTTGGRAFLKSCAWVFDIEPSVTAALHRAVPGLVPDVIATDAAEGWLLMRDAGGAPAGDGPAATWSASVGALAVIQQAIHQATPGGLDGMVLEDRGPLALAAALPELLESTFVAGFPDDIGPRFRASAARLADTCAQLASLRPGLTVIHGDFHPGNVLVDGARVVVIDWSDSALGHPFADLATWLNRTDDVAARHEMVDAWLACWADTAPRAELEEAVRLGLVVGALHQVESYRRIMATLEPGTDAPFLGAGGSFARWAFAWLDNGLAAQVPRRRS